MDTAITVITFVASYNGRCSKQELERFIAQVGDLIVPCHTEAKRARHEEAAVAACIIEDDRVRLAALEALFMHGMQRCLPMLRGMTEEVTLSKVVRDAAQMAHFAVSERCGERGTVSLPDALVGAVSR